MSKNNKEQIIQKKIEEITGLKTDINQEVCFDLVKNFRRYRVKKILLLSSSFDYFLLEEEGRLSSLFNEWCSYSDEGTPPDITHVETGEECLRIIDKENFDLLIIFNLEKNEPIISISESIAKKTNMPIVVLGNNIKKLSELANKNTVIDKTGPARRCQRCQSQISNKSRKRASKPLQIEPTKITSAINQHITVVRSMLIQK